MVPRCGKIIGTGFIAFGVGASVVGGILLHDYYTKPQAEKMDLLKTTGAYVEKYDGPNLEETLEYAGLTLKIAPASSITSIALSGK